MNQIPESLAKEIAYCEGAQSFSPGSTRSSWGADLQEFADAFAARNAYEDEFLRAEEAYEEEFSAWQGREATDPEEMNRLEMIMETARRLMDAATVYMDECYEFAIDRSYELAALKAQDMLVSPTDLCEQIVAKEVLNDDQIAVIYDCEVAAQIVRHLKEWKVLDVIDLDMTVNGAKDGWVINGQEQHAYAACRQFDDEANPSWVMIDILTSRITRL